MGVMNMKFGGKQYLSKAERPDLTKVGAKPGVEITPIFHKNPNTPGAKELMNSPVAPGEGDNRDNNPYMTVADLPDDWFNLMVNEAKIGRGPTSFMRVLGLTRAGLETILATSPEFAEAYERCLILSSEWWEDRGRDMTVGEKGNSSVWLANMVNRWGWNSERTDNRGDPNVSIKVSTGQRELTDAELDAELEKRGLSMNLIQPPAGVENGLLDGQTEDLDNPDE